MKHMKVENVEFQRVVPDPRGTVVPILEFLATIDDGRSWVIPLNFSFRAATELRLLELWDRDRGRPHPWLEQTCRHYIAVCLSVMHEDEDPTSPDWVGAIWLVTEAEFFKRQANLSRNSPGTYMPREHYRR